MLNSTFSPDEILFSKKLPAAERKQKRIQQLEQNLLAHPLALFPNLEQGLNPELYDEIGNEKYSITIIFQVI